jgi:Glycosyltransferase like family
LEVNLYSDNTKGLSEIYNLEINKLRNEPSILVFAHDDLFILDYFWMHSILNGLSHFGIVGVAGNKKRAPMQASWCFLDEKFTWDAPENLSGVIGHGNSFPPVVLSDFGSPFQEVKLLDGVFLAAYRETLIKGNIRFDEQFKFHFYDMDFCRQAESQGISMGTVPLSLIHESVGNPSADSWEQSYKLYLKKWKQ